MHLLYCLALAFAWVLVQGEDYFDVLSMKNIPFPSSREYAAAINVEYKKDIPEFTVCYRFQIESYNDNEFDLIKAKDMDNTIYMDRIGWQTGMEKDGFQAGVVYFKRNIPGGGLAKKRFPSFHHYNLARNIDISKWTHMCTSYSSILHRMHMYQDGLYVYSYDYIDEQEDPLPLNTFHKVLIGKNMRGLYTDVNIYSSYFDDKEMISWTTGCDWW